MNAQDFLLDNDGDLLFTEDGDLGVGISDPTHVSDIINANKGWYKNNLEVGCEIEKYIGSVGKEQELERIIRIQLENDGYKVLDVKVDLVDFDQTIINAYRVK